MKKTALVLFIGITSIFISCEKESTNPESDSQNSLTEENIVGTWNVTGYLLENGSVTASLDGESSSSSFSSIGKDYDMTVTFNNDPKTSVSNGSYTIVNTSIFEGDPETYVTEQTASTAFQSSVWNIEDERFYFVSSSKETEVMIPEFSSSKFVMVIELDENVVDPSTGVTISTTGKLTVTLEK